MIFKRLESIKEILGSEPFYNLRIYALPESKHIFYGVKYSYNEILFFEENSTFNWVTDFIIIEDNHIIFQDIMEYTLNGYKPSSVKFTKKKVL